MLYLATRRGYRSALVGPLEKHHPYLGAGRGRQRLCRSAQARFARNSAIIEKESYRLMSQRDARDRLPADPTGTLRSGGWKPPRLVASPTAAAEPSR
jgi:hypothetical protein